ncbi:MAG: MarR family transcriptional regulator [Acidobacteria bacterium]|nr:MAG: MarR family transcriptional regulator [Acidobacteriota bacterium]
MVVRSSVNTVILSRLDLPYLGFFLGLRVNELVMEQTWKAGFRGLRDSHGYVIQHLIEGDRTITELANRMDVTQQAASKMIAELVQLGILELVPARDRRAKWVRLSNRGWRCVVPARDRRAKWVRLSNRGWRCVELGRRSRAKIESRIMRAAGKSKYEMAKLTVLSCLESLGEIERIRSRRIRAPR